MNNRSLDLITILGSVAITIVCAIAIVSMLTGCVWHVGVLDATIATEGAFETLSKTKRNFTSGNQSDLTKSHSNLVYEEAEYEQIQQDRTQKQK